MNLLLPLLPTAQQLLCVAFTIFKWFGFIPFPFDCLAFKVQPPSYRWSAFVFPVLQFLFYVALHTIVATHRKIMFYTEYQVLDMNDILKYGIQLTVVYLVLINTIVQRAVYRAVWTNLSQLRGTVRKQLFYGYIAFTLFIEMQLLVGVLGSPPGVAYWALILVLHTFIRLRHLFHVFFIDVLKLHLNHLKLSLVEETEYAKGLRSASIRQRSISRLLELKNAYGHLWELNDNINRSFGWSQICNFTANFVQLSCDFYWCYLAARGFSFEGCKEIFLTLLPTSCLLGILLHSAESCLRLGSSLGTIVLEFPTGNDRTLQKIVYRFALQMSQQRIHFTAHRLLDVNYTLLKMFGTGIATYMTIFISFSKDLPLTSRRHA
ncbi:putative gustatory receptor 39b [Anopheles bellator]|uniref:putative gustatory receptor 39b n=1 Tax=Anopheles bellator TaxID=139047 RepID=UPI0026482841|nr:putative gustatory receptor 39b [Anopheles bellator]